MGTGGGRDQRLLRLSILFTLTVLILVLALRPTSPPPDSVASSEWIDTCHGAEVFISLAADARWATNRTEKITFLFAVTSLGSSLDAPPSTNDSYIILEKVSLDPTYINKTESPCAELSEREAWSVDWYFTPKAQDPALYQLGISGGKEVEYTMDLYVDYMVIDPRGQQPCLFQTSPSHPFKVRILGAEDAPQ